MSARSLITCSEHGKRRRAYVCQHILAQLRDGRPRGVTWQHFDEDDSFEAFCDSCIDLLDGCKGERPEGIDAELGCTLICEACLDSVLKFNGKMGLN